MIKQYQKGVTLVELMIVIGIVAILAAIAIPAYQNYLERGRLAAAKQIMVAAKQFYEEGKLDKPNDFDAADKSQTAINNYIQSQLAGSNINNLYSIKALVAGNGKAAYMVAVTIPVNTSKKGLYMNYRGDVYKCNAGAITGELTGKGVKPANCGNDRF